MYFGIFDMFEKNKIWVKDWKNRLVSESSDHSKLDVPKSVISFSDKKFDFSPMKIVLQFQGDFSLLHYPLE